MRNLIGKVLDVDGCKKVRKNDECIKLVVWSVFIYEREGDGVFID